MAVTATNHCRLRSRLLRCRAEPEGVCQYCGRPFCGRHGIVLEDGQEICSRKACVAKRRDLERHLSYKSVVQARNATGVCGIPGCEGRLGGQCSRCQGYFCPKHVHRRDETFAEGMTRSVRMASLCHHCWARRPIWLRN